MNDLKDNLACLIIDDSVEDVKLICKYAQCAQVDTAPTIKESIPFLINPILYDVIFIDHNLPDGDSFDLIKLIREKSTIVPIVVITGLADYNLAIQTLRAGASGFLAKAELNGHTLQEVMKTVSEERKNVHRTLLKLTEIENKLNSYQ